MPTPPAEGIAHLHLDPLGGIAGDMVAAALLDAFPALEVPLGEALARSGAPPGAALRRVAHKGGALAGSRAVVEVPAGAPPSGRFAGIAERLGACGLAAPVRARALAIYRLLAEAEARVHGVAVGEVHFHELADWDSYLDIVAAAWLVERLGAPACSASPLPLGRGRVATAHGVLPVPAPATALLLEGLPVHDDGVPGERVTPTGAAILRHLAPVAGPRSGLRIAASGHGFGARVLDGAVPNLLRVLAFAAGEGGGVAAADRVAVIRFEVDDQTGEDLATALDRLRALPPVRDACQWPVLAKKGRLAAAVQVLCDPAALDAVADACLAETATIGLRWRVEERRVLAREDLPGGGGKRVRRPDGVTTVKADADRIAAAGGYAARAILRREVEGG